MRCLHWSVQALGVLLLAAAAAVTAANEYSPRQYYGSYRKHPKQNYYYRPYYYKPSPSYAGYKHQYVIYTPSKPDYVYFYNPYKKQYWGRCPAQCHGKPQYSMLPPEYRKPNLDEIDESAFPPMGKPPAVPESDDGALLELPPDDLPSDNLLPAGK